MMHQLGAKNQDYGNERKKTAGSSEEKMGITSSARASALACFGASTRQFLHMQRKEIKGCKFIH
jgi:hypothetical protein